MVNLWFILSIQTSPITVYKTIGTIGVTYLFAQLLPRHMQGMGEAVRWLMDEDVEKPPEWWL